MPSQPWLHDLVTVLSAPTVVLSEDGGQIRPGGGQGALHADCRVLSEAILEVAGTEPVPVSGGPTGAGTALFIGAPRGLGDPGPDPTVLVERERKVSPGRVAERIRVVSTAETGVAADLVLRVAADLAGLGEIKAGLTPEPTAITVAAGPVPQRARVPVGGPAGRMEAGPQPGDARQPAPGRPGRPATDSAELDSAELDGAELDGAELDSAELDGAELDGAGAGMSERGNAQLTSAQLDRAELVWGRDSVRVRLTAPAASVSANGGGEMLLRWPVRLAGGGSHEVTWELAVTDAAAVVAAPGDHLPGDSVPGDHLPGDHVPGPVPWGAVAVSSPDARLPRLVEQSLADAAALRLATTRSPGDVFLAAGAPWYFTLFGRDSIWAARLLLPFGWQLAAGTLRALAAFQGRRTDPATAEAPGKIPHELRQAGRSGSRQSPGLPPLYYGTIDATPLWVCLLHDAWRWGMPAAQVRELLPSMTAALACLRDHGDADGDGFLEYIDESGNGLANQGWKDSGDAVRFADGRVARPPVALCEVQGYAYEAAMHGADLLDHFGEPGADAWRAWAGKLAAAFRASFWVSDDAGRYPALALDGGKRPADAVTSNIGHLLGTGLLDAGEEALVVQRLTGPVLDSGFGLRTMSSASGGYSPVSYHCGSVWSHDTAIVISGLARSGHGAAAAALGNGLLDAAAGFGWRLPELFAGHPRSAVPWPSPYPASCRPQAWAAAAAGALVQATLGLAVNVPGGTIALSPPSPAPGERVTPVHVAGLVAGEETFAAGVGADGDPYLQGLSLDWC